MSFPPGTEMFQFSGFASPKPILFSLVIPLPFNADPGSSPGLALNGEGGLSHSEIAGSKPAHGSPTLIAACHVLHRLYMPRHSPDALTSRLRVHTTNGNPVGLPSIMRMLNLSQIYCVRHNRSRRPEDRPNRSASPRHRLKNPFTMSKRGAPSGRPEPPARPVEYVFFIPREFNDRPINAPTNRRFASANARRGLCRASQGCGCSRRRLSTQQTKPFAQQMVELIGIEPMT